MKTYLKNYWLGKLAEIEKLLPSLLEDQSQWKNIFVDYEEPFVERLWIQHDECRIYLHKIHPVSGRALFHAHPWPSAMRIVQGSYVMDVGHGIKKPSVAATINLVAGSMYEMSDVNGWHSVAPIDGSTYTVMITGEPWNRESPKSSYKLRELTSDEREHLLSVFRKYYPL